MKKNLSLLIYEKDETLNSILMEQLGYLSNYEITLINNYSNLFNLINKKSFDVCILNLEDLEDDIENFIKVFKNNNKHNNIIIYHQKEIKNLFYSESAIIYIQKPFKLNTLLKYLKDIKNNKKIDETKLLFIKDLVFMPDQKIILNNRTNEKEHLTEKETDLLKYLLKNQNTEMSKSYLLTEVWGIKENVNTHTLETHLYRLKQKLYKLEPKLTFSLINENGKYFLKNIT